MKENRRPRWGGRIRRPLTVEVVPERQIHTNIFGKVVAERLYLRARGRRVSARRLPGDTTGLLWPIFRGKIQRQDGAVTLVGSLRETRYCAFSWILWAGLAAAMLAVTVAMVTGSAHAPWYVALIFAGFTAVFAVLTWYSIVTRYEGFDTFGSEVEGRLRAWGQNLTFDEFTTKQWTERFLRAEDEAASRLDSSSHGDAEGL